MSCQLQCFSALADAAGSAAAGAGAVPLPASPRAVRPAARGRQPPDAPAAKRQRTQTTAFTLNALSDSRAWGHAKEALLPSMRRVADPTAYGMGHTVGEVACALLDAIGSCVVDCRGSLAQLEQLYAPGTRGAAGGGGAASGATAPSSTLPPRLLFQHPYCVPHGEDRSQCMHGRRRPTAGISLHGDGYLRMQLGMDDDGVPVWEYCHRIVAWAAYGLWREKGCDVCCHKHDWQQAPRCCSPTCLNPKHLHWGTHRDNMRHMANVGPAGQRGYTRGRLDARIAARELRLEAALAVQQRRAAS